MFSVRSSLLYATLEPCASRSLIVFPRRDAAFVLRKRGLSRVVYGENTQIAKRTREEAPPRNMSIAVTSGVNKCWRKFGCMCVHVQRIRFAVCGAFSFFFSFSREKKKRCTIGAPAAAINGACDACRFISRICSSEEVAEIRSSFEEALRKRRLISSETRGAN